MGDQFRKLSMDELQRHSVEAHRAGAKWPVVLVMDNIRSHHNIGSLFRTADAFRIERIVLCGITSTPPHREIHKTALGATESVDWSYTPDTSTAIVELRALGFHICALEQATNATDIRQLSTVNRPADGLALIVGNEVTGIDDQVLALCDTCLVIPQEGTKHSLNVSVAGGIALWEIFRLMAGTLSTSP